MRKYLNAYKVLLPTGKTAFMTIMLILISSFISFVIPFMNGKVVNTLVSHNINSFISIAIFIMILYLIGNISNYFTEKIIIGIQFKVINDYKIKLLQSVMNSSLDFRETISASEFQSRFNEINSISALISTTIYKLIISFFVMLFIIVYIFVFSVKLFIVVLCIIPIYYLINLKSFNMINLWTIKAMNANVKLAGRVNSFFVKVDFLNSISTKKFVNSTYESINETGNIQKELNNSINIANNGIMLFNNILFISIAMISGIIIIKGNENVGMYVTLTQYITYVFTPLTLLSTVNLTLQPGLVAYNRTIEYINNFSANEKMDGTILIDEVEKVTVTNPRYKNRISKSYMIYSVIGERNKITGENGVGKSTLLKLIANLYNDDQEESIMINNVNVQKIKNSSLNNLIHFCPQEIILLSTSVKENILIEIPYSKHDYYLKKLNEDLLTQKVINSLELSKIVNETASNLSLGEKKKIALLRLAITEKQILLIDELDASLDKESKVIMENVLSKKKKAIIFEISHNNIE